MRLMTSPQTVHLEFQSSFDVVELVQAVGDQVARMVGFDDDDRHWVGVAIRESVINAIRHGNASDASKRVSVDFTSLETDAVPSLAIRVRDEGEGFNPAELPDPLASDNLLRASGRGIFLIRNFMDELVLERTPDGGMEVFMLKRVPVAPKSA